MARRRWILLAVLAVQAGLSLRLVWSNTIFPDEALYLWAGHLEWSHWLHGDALPPFPTFFSGAPVVYPPLGALADAAGGLAAARVMSLCFMLVATLALYCVAKRLFGWRAALFAAGVFAVLAPTQYLGAFATYDAMALMLLAVATWLGVRAAERRSAARVALLVATSAILVLADTAKYAATLFMPVVIAVVVLAVWRRAGRGAGLRAAAGLVAGCGAFMAAAIVAGGQPYWGGITSTTLTRAPGTDSVAFLLFVSAKWEGAAVVLALIGTATLIATARKRWSLILLASVLAVAPFLVPIEQARINTYTSLFKHIDYGMWFGAMLAGVCLASFPRAVAPRKAVRAIQISLVTAIIVAIPHFSWAASHYGWPDTSPIMPTLTRQLAATKGPILADDRGNVIDYYLHQTLGGREIDGTFFFAYNDPVSGRHLTDAAAFAAAIRERHFDLIFLEFWDSAQQDNVVRRDIERYGGYRLAAVIPYRATGEHGKAMIWVRQKGRT